MAWYGTHKTEPRMQHINHTCPMSIALTMKCHNIPLPTDYIASRHAGFVRSFQPNICHYVSSQCHGSPQIRFPIIPRTWYLNGPQSVVQCFLIEVVNVLTFVIIVDGINTCIASFAHMMEKWLWSHQLCCWYIILEYCSLRTGKTIIYYDRGDIFLVVHAASLNDKPSIG